MDKVFLLCEGQFPICLQEWPPDWGERTRLDRWKQSTTCNKAMRRWMVPLSMDHPFISVVATGNTTEGSKAKSTDWPAWFKLDIRYPPEIKGLNEIINKTSNTSHIQKREQDLIERIPRTCVRVGSNSRRMLLDVNIKFPVGKPCRTNSRKRRAWYDTLLGGVGTGLGVINGIDLEMLSGKLASVGQKVDDYATIQAKWMPTTLLPHEVNFQLQKERQVWINDVIMHEIEVQKGMEAFSNWTVCTLRTVAEQSQKSVMQSMLMTGNEQIWREMIDKTTDHTWILVHTPKLVCNLTNCVGKVELYSPQTIQKLCKFIVLPLIVGKEYWMPSITGNYIDESNRTYDLSVCTNTYDGIVCRGQASIYEPCLAVSSQSMCHWTIYTTTGFSVMHETAPQTICMVTDDPGVIPGLSLTIPFVGCVQNVSHLIWKGEHFYLYPEETDRYETTFNTTVNIDYGTHILPSWKKILEQSEYVQQLLQRLNTTIGVHKVYTIRTANKLIKIGHEIKDATVHHFYDMFTGWSPTVTQVLSYVVPGALIFVVLLCVLSVWNTYVFYRLICKPHVVYQPAGY